VGILESHALRPRLLKHTIWLLLGLTFALHANAEKGAHLWYDEDGNAVYSQFAPQGDKRTEIIKPPPPPAEAPEVAQERLRQQLQRFEDNREDRELAHKKSAQARQEAARASERCATARQQLENLNGSARRLFRNSDGTVSRLSNEQREEKRAEMEKVIASDCG